VSVLAVEGPGALALVASWSSAQLAPGDLSLVRLAHAGDLLDEALVCAFGPERVELHVHGSPPLVRALLRLAAEPEGIGPAASLEERALELLARAPGESAARVLLDQAEGALRRELEALAALDPGARAERVASLAQRSATLRFLFEPPRVLLAGPVNAGKSTLFNVLVGSRRAIESSEEGTTRDLLREPAQLGAWPIFLTDGAGTRPLEGRDPTSELERAGQALVRRAAQSVDLVLWLDPPHSGQAPPGGSTPVVRLPSRGDLSPHEPERLRPREDPSGALRRVEAALCQALNLPREPWLHGAGVAFDARGRALLEELRGASCEVAQRTLEAELSRTLPQPGR
jgi:tRNA modification GTPase